MKLTRIELWQESLQQYIPLDFHDPKGTNQYFIKDATGLDADEISAQFYGTGSKNYRNLRIPKRTVVFKIGLRPQYSIGSSYSDLRDYIYKFISSTRTGKIQIRFMNESNEIARLSGYVSKLESAHFDLKQEILISIDCSDPLLKAPVPIGIPVFGLDPSGFLVNDDKSTAPHGLTIWLEMLSSSPSITFRDPFTDTSWSFQLLRVGGFTTSDIVAIDTDQDNRVINLFRGSNVYSIADSIVPGSAWPIVFPGQNLFSIDEATKVSLLDINFQSAYWGV